MHVFLEDGCLERNLPDRTFKVGIYTRLSREDNHRPESESIANQKDFLIRFVNEHCWNLVEIYTDDGYSGTSFDRPDFNRMIGDIENKKINLVITKDLSRLGRDYIETGYYVEKYFPSRKVRYIAVNDGVDTFSNNCSNDMSPFKQVMDDLYAKDISKKVRTSVALKRKNGKFIGAFAPYGYKKDPEDKNKLIIDESVGWVVKRIFDMFLHGMGFIEISKILNNEGIPSPGGYKKRTSNYRGKGGSTGLWSSQTIKYLLSNPTYAGNISQNKYTKVSYKINKLERVDKASWIIVNGTHQPIIEDETFELVQQLIGSRYTAKYIPKAGTHLLSGLVFCGDCGSRMTFLVNRDEERKQRVYCVCSRYKRYGLCTRHSVSEKELEEVVLCELRKVSEYLNERDKLLERAKSKVKLININYYDKRSGILQMRLHDIQKAIKGLYDDRTRGIIYEEDFIYLLQQYNKEREILTQDQVKLQKEKHTGHINDTNEDGLFSKIKELADFKNIEKSILFKLIARIDVFEKKSISIRYRFIKPF